MTTPSLKVKFPAPFPVNVVGAGGVKVTKADGVWSITPDLASLSPLTYNSTEVAYSWAFNPISGQMGLGSLPRKSVSGNLSIALAATVTFAHGLGVVPDLWSVKLVCVTTDLGYAVDDLVAPHVDSSTAGTGFASYADATNVKIITTSAANIILPNKSTGVVGAITLAKWAYVATAIRF